MENLTNINVDDLKTAKEEIESVCKKHNIILIPVVVHQGDRTFSSIEIARANPAPVADTPEANA